MPPPSLLETFRTLASFAPERVSLRGAPWEAYVDLAIANGLAPLASYNLEYRLTGGNAPEWVRDRLSSIYAGSANDNVMKLVNFKRSIDELEGRRIIAFGGASYAEALYPHVAFRPVLEIQLLGARADVDGLEGFMKQSHFKASPGMEAATGATRVLSDDHTELLLYASYLGAGFEKEEAALFDRATQMRFYGPSIYRLTLEDAIVIQCLEHAQLGYDVPLLSFVDLRELLMGAQHVSSDYSHPFDAALVHERAKAWKAERAVYASVSIVEKLFPETKDAAARAKPSLRRATRELLDRGVVTPLSNLEQTRTFHGSERLRRLLTGGRRALRVLENPS
jgi:hypothetical protein